jgi:hypothetical protein
MYILQLYQDTVCEVRYNTFCTFPCIVIEVKGSWCVVRSQKSGSGQAYNLQIK